MTDRDKTSAEAMDDLISAYADGELDEASAATVEAYLSDHPAALRTLAMHRETSALLRTAFATAAGGTATGMSVLPAAAAPVRRRRRLPAPAWAVAASILVGVAGYGAGATWPGLIESERSRLLSEVAEYHEVYSRETAHLVEVPASQADHLQDWLGKRIKGPLPIPDFKQAGLTFAGGRMVVVDGAPVAELMYTRAGGPPIGFCVLYRPGKPVPLSVERRGDMNLATWDDGTHGYIIVGEADAATVKALAVLAQRQV